MACNLPLVVHDVHDTNTAQASYKGEWGSCNKFVLNNAKNKIKIFLDFDSRPNIQNLEYLEFGLKTLVTLMYLFVFVEGCC